MSWIQSEPAVFFGLVQALIAAILNLILVFGVDVTADQIAAINTVVLAVTAVVLSVWTRSKVTPTANL